MNFCYIFDSWGIFLGRLLFYWSTLVTNGIHAHYLVLLCFVDFLVVEVWWYWECLLQLTLGQSAIRCCAPLTCGISWSVLVPVFEISLCVLMVMSVDGSYIGEQRMCLVNCTVLGHYMIWGSSFCLALMLSLLCALSLSLCPVFAGPLWCPLGG